MLKNLLIAISLLCSLSALAQQRFEVGIEGAVTNVKYKFNDPGDNLRPVAAVSGMAGINFRYNLRKPFFLEAALLVTEYAEGMKLKQQSFSGYSNSDLVMLLPLRVGFYLPVYKSIAITPLVGVAPAIKLVNENGASSSVNSTSNTYYEYSSRMLNKDVFMLMQGGIGLQWSLLKRIRAGLSANYYYGLQTHKVFDVQYRVNGGAIQQAIVEGKGSQLSYQLSLRYAFGRK